MAMRRSLALAVTLFAVVTGCGSVPVSPSPSAAAATPSLVSPDPSASGAADPWVVASVAQPSAVTSAPSLPAGVQCHPCHFLAENQFLGVMSSPLGPIAVGVQQAP